MSNVRPVVCVETGRVFESGTMAAKMMGVSQSGIYNALNGNSQTCAGYHWEYADGRSVQKPAKRRMLHHGPAMTIEDVQKEAARRTRETGRYTDYADIQKEETVALIRQRDKMAKLKKEAKR